MMAGLKYVRFDNITGKGMYTKLVNLNGRAENKKNVIVMFWKVL